MSKEKSKSCPHTVPTWLICDACLEDKEIELRESRDYWKERAEFFEEKLAADHASSYIKERGVLESELGGFRASHKLQHEKILHLKEKLIRQKGHFDVDRTLIEEENQSIFEIMQGQTTEAETETTRFQE